jgi:hypothetical protein
LDSSNTGFCEYGDKPCGSVQTEYLLAINILSVPQRDLVWEPTGYSDEAFTLSNSFSKSHSGMAGMTCVPFTPTLMMVPSGGGEASSRGLKAREAKIEFRSSRQRS